MKFVTFYCVSVYYLHGLNHFVPPENQPKDDKTKGDILQPLQVSPVFSATVIPEGTIYTALTTVHTTNIDTNTLQ